MIHNHAFAPAPRRLALPRAPDAVPLKAAEYLRLRRVAARLSERDLAQRMAAVWLHSAVQSREDGGALPLSTRPTVRVLIAQMQTIVQALELPSSVARRAETIEAIALVLPFDPAVYWQLARAAPNRHPRVCRGCGASTHDDGDPVTWKTPTSCTRCAAPADCG
jgi:hypothetical protein